MNNAKDKSLPINENIRVPRLQVITTDGENHGVITRDQALKLAKDHGLDLVIVSDTGSEGVPVAKIVDYGKVLYAKKKKQAEAKKHQKVIQIKEIKIRPKISDHDYQTKIKQAVQFLKDGKHVKVTLVFRGREIANIKERGNELFDKFSVSLAEYGLADIAHDKDTKSGSFWSRIYTVKK